MELLVLFFLAAAIILMVVAVIKYYRLLAFFRVQVYGKRTLSHWAYSASFLLVVFFLFSYLFVAQNTVFETGNRGRLAVSIILFGGSIFVLFVIAIVKRLSKTITSKLENIFAAMIEVLEARDYYTKGHSEQVRNLSMLLWEKLPAKERKQINPVLLSDAAYLHDIGKITVPDAILNKAGALDDEEWRIMRTHPEKGKLMLDKTGFENISNWVVYHHERIDGKGYYGMGEEEIPLEAKIIAVADVFSALYTDRVYRAKLPFEVAIGHIRDGAGTQFDPALAALFIAIPKEKLDAAMELQPVGGKHVHS